jgi:hypothetical protein
VGCVNKVSCVQMGHDSVFVTFEHCSPLKHVLLGMLSILTPFAAT